MVLVDTSIWIDHFRNINDQLVTLLNDGKVYCHPFIIGELACGNIKNRNEILTDLQELPQAVLLEHDEILFFIKQKKLMGQGLGYIDMALLASALVTGVPLWTYDKKLRGAASKLGVGYIK